MIKNNFEEFVETLNKINIKYVIFSDEYYDNVSFRTINDYSFNFKFDKKTGNFSVTALSWDNYDSESEGEE